MDHDVSSTTPTSDRAPGVLEMACAYAARGWSVLPIAPRDKRPLIAWTELQHRHAEEPEIRAWLKRWPDANIGIVTGRISGLIVLDIDPRNGGDDSICRIEHDFGPIPETHEVITGQGGRHLYFLYPGRRLSNVVGLLEGVDLRGDGGLVVAPPSIHPNGNPYAWRPGHGPNETALTGLPEWVGRLLRGARRGAGHGPAYWRDLLTQGVEEGARNNSITSIAGHLLWHGVAPEVARELLLCWNWVRCRPPLDDDEVVRVVESVTRLNERKA